MQRSPAENLLTQRSPAGLTCHHSVPLRSSLGNAAPPCEVVLLTQHLPARFVVDADLSCGVVLFSQHPPARIVVDADLSCEVVLFSQHPPARHIDDADLSCEVDLFSQHPHPFKNNVKRKKIVSRHGCSERLPCPFLCKIQETPGPRS
jgi:hypothetical protein